MGNFFLHTKACDVSDCELFVAGLSELNAVFVNREDDDTILKHNNIWEVPIMEKLFALANQESAVLCGFLEQVSTHDNDIDTKAMFDSFYPNQLNAFWGIDFSKTTVEKDFQISNQTEHFSVKDEYLWGNVTADTLWTQKEDLFPSLLFCQCVYYQCARLGNSPDFRRILVGLSKLDRFVGTWVTGAFDLKHIAESFGLTITGESQSTLAQYGDERIFALPSGGNKTFELHIKLGSLRIHIYPDSQTHKVYIGYIGKHLRTVKYN